jgi:hypothetical protein
LEIIRRFVRGLSYEGSIVLDFFAGSGTTGRVCIEENRHSIMVDADASLNTYFKKHIGNMGTNFFQKPYQTIHDIEIKELLAKMNEQSKNLELPLCVEAYQEGERTTILTPSIPAQEKIAVYAAAANHDVFDKQI